MGYDLYFTLHIAGTRTDSKNSKLLSRVLVGTYDAAIRHRPDGCH